MPTRSCARMVDLLGVSEAFRGQRGRLGGASRAREDGSGEPEDEDLRSAME